MSADSRWRIPAYGEPADRSGQLACAVGVCAVADESLRDGASDPAHQLLLVLRFSAIDLRLRFCCAALYVGLPNSAEIDANITTLQWHLALLAMIVLLAKPMASKLWMVFDF